jgi:transketolase
MCKMISNREAYGDTLVAIGETNPHVVVLEADLGKSTQTIRFRKRFPERHLEMGIAEANMMGYAAGLAATGKIPFASTFCVFASMRAIESIRNSIAYPQLNVKIVATNAGIEIGPDGATHQAIEDIAITRAIPNLTVLAPSDPTVTINAIKAAVEWEGPMYIRLGRLATPKLYQDDLGFEIGKAILSRQGTDVTIVAIGNMVCRALTAAEQLAAQGISARVLDMHTVKPIDVEALVDAAEQTGCVVTAEDHNILGGLGGAVSEILGTLCPVPVIRVGIDDCFAESGEADELLEKYGLTSERIVAAAVESMRLRDD